MKTLKDEIITAQRKKYRIGSQVLIDEITEYKRIVDKLDDYFLTAKFDKLSEKIKKSLELDRFVSFRAMLNTRYELKKLLNNDLEIYQHVTINAEADSVKTP
jgi:hypothetical protein